MHQKSKPQLRDRAFQTAMEISLTEDCGVFVVYRQGEYYWCRDYDYRGNDLEIVAEYIAGEQTLR